MKNPKSQASNYKEIPNPKHQIIKWVFIFLLFLFITLPVLAVEDSTFSSQIKEKIKERLEKTATESAETETENNQTEKEETQSKTNKYYAWVGSLSKIEENTLFIQTSKEEKQAEVNDKTTILQTPKKGRRQEVDLEELEEDNFIIAMGELAGEKISAKRIISTPPAEEESEKKVVFGKVAEIEDKKLTLQNGEETILTITENSFLSIKGAKEPEISNIQLEDKLYAIVYQEEIKAIFVIPGKNNPENETKKKLQETPPPATPSGETETTKESPPPESEEE